MPQQIYNEGRVVGMSAYEIYLRHLMSEHPDVPPLTEREWLASTIGNGCSMILRVPKGTAGIWETPLPSNSALCAASNITASVFDGQVATSDGTWATKVISYGPLISNTAAKHPVPPGDTDVTVPKGEEWTNETRYRLKEYMKIIDGLVYQPGEWETNPETDKTPYMDFKSPKLRGAVVRLNISKKLENDVYVTLSGWVHGSILAGSAKLDAGALKEIHPENGDFLGAERFPWAVRILFTVPTGLMHILNDKSYARELITGSGTKAVASKAIVDLESTNLESFYKSTDSSTYSGKISDSRIPLNVTELNVTGDGASVVSAYQKDASYPPILYGAKVTHTGSGQYMMPIDTAAPGTVKVFNNRTKAINYPKVVPNTYAFYHNKPGQSVYFVDGDNTIPLNTTLTTKNTGTVTTPKFEAVTTSGDTQIAAISLLDTQGQKLNTAGTKKRSDGKTLDTIDILEDDYLNWDKLLTALGANRSIDLIGSDLRTFRKNLPDIVSGKGGILDIKGTGQSKIAGSLSVKEDLSVSNNLTVSGKITGTRGENDKNEVALETAGLAKLCGSVNISRGNNGLTYHIGCFEDGKTVPLVINGPIKVESNYIEFGSKRLYITNDKPDAKDVPIGSIGIGW